MMKTLILDGGDTILIGKNDMAIAEGIANGSTITEIGQKGKIKKRTMEARVNKLKAKTGCKTLPEVVALFFRNNLIK